MRVRGVLARGASHASRTNGARHCKTLQNGKAQICNNVAHKSEAAVYLSKSSKSKSRA